jgi:hypothetical protein
MLMLGARKSKCWRDIVELGIGLPFSHISF